MRYLLVLVILSGCANQSKSFLANEHSNEKWGVNTQHTLYDSKGILVQADLVQILATLNKGYRTDKETWEISVINNNDTDECVEVMGLVDRFKVIYHKQTPIQVASSKSVVLWKVEQVSAFEDLLKFEYYRNSFFAISLRNCN
jgi:thiamine biosynthesis lipoprotein ApbE